MGLGRCVVTNIICTGVPKYFYALWSLIYVVILLQLFVVIYFTLIFYLIKLSC